MVGPNIFVDTRRTIDTSGGLDWVVAACPKLQDSTIFGHDDEQSKSITACQRQQQTTLRVLLSPVVT